MVIRMYRTTKPIRKRGYLLAIATNKQKSAGMGSKQAAKQYKLSQPELDVLWVEILMSSL